jgi:hypothetical protein
MLHLDGRSVYVLVYFDDLLLAEKLLSDVQNAEGLRMSAFDARDQGEAKHVVGMNYIWERGAKSLRLVQKQYAAVVFARFGMSDAKPVAVTTSVSVKLYRDGDEPLEVSVFSYRDLVGSWMYYAVCTRPEHTHWLCCTVHGAAVSWSSR